MPRPESGVAPVPAYLTDLIVVERDMTLPKVSVGEILALQGEGGSDPWAYVKLMADASTTSTASIATALAFTPPTNSVVIFEGQLFLQAASITTGARPGVAWPSAGVLQTIARIESPNSATAAAVRFAGGAASANVAATGIPVANQSAFGQIQGTLATGAVVTGSVVITIASEIAASEVRLMANSWLRWRTI